MELFGVKPGRRVAIYFLGAILLGAVLLSLPVASTGEPMEFLDALFTATSAICVTGLSVVDVARDLSDFGQVVLLLLIQLGGLGIMTFASGLLLSIGSSLSFQHKFALSETLGGSSVRSGSLIKAVLWTTVIIELLGAAALFFRFRSDLPIGRALFVSLFHSVSAFCNAGFSLFDGSLEGFRGDTPTLLIFAFLIISGGLGFIVIREVLTSASGRKRGLSLHTRLCLSATAILLVAGTLGFYLAEQEHILGSRGMGLDLVNSFFQAVTCRTAGFSTVAMTDLTELSLLIAMILMFIGACPGSTGGGIKATTVAIVLLLVYRRFRGRQSVTVFKRTISNDSLIRAVAVILLAILVIVVMFSMFTFFEEKPVAHNASHGWFVENLFEVISAFATVGLSLGATAHLHAAGKMLLIILMFIGRVGLLTLAFALASPTRRGEIVYREEEVMVG